jgi:hypothetical protein
VQSNVRQDGTAEWLGSSTIAKVVTDHWVKDLDSAVARFAGEFGIGPWKRAELKAPLVRDVVFRGEPADIYWSAAMAEIGPLAIEVLEVRGGSGPVLEWADQMQDGSWHFVSYHRERADAEREAQKLMDSNFVPVLSGIVGESRFFMFDFDPIFGRMFEIAGGDLGDVKWDVIDPPAGGPSGRGD